MGARLTGGRTSVTSEGAGKATSKGPASAPCLSLRSELCRPLALRELSVQSPGEPGPPLAPCSRDQPEEAAL